MRLLKEHGFSVRRRIVSSSVSAVQRNDLSRRFRGMSRRMDGNRWPIVRTVGAIQSSIVQPSTSTETATGSGLP